MAHSLESIPLVGAARPRAERAPADRGASELAKQLSVFVAAAAGLFLLFAIDTAGGGPAALFASTLVTALITGVMFGLVRWASLLESTLSAVPAVLLSGVFPALLGRAFVQTYDAAPKLFRAKHLAGLWVAAFALAIVIG